MKILKKFLLFSIIGFMSISSISGKSFANQGNKYMQEYVKTRTGRSNKERRENFRKHIDDMRNKKSKKRDIVYPNMEEYRKNGKKLENGLIRFLREKLKNLKIVQSL